MNKDDFYYLGKILKPYGNKGQLQVHLDVDEPETYTTLESVFLDLHGERVPFFIDSLELRGSQKAIIHFKEVGSIEEATVFSGLEMYLPLGQLPPLKGNQFYHHEIIGFSVIDEKHGNIGAIENILEYPNQSLFQIRFGEKEILVPVVDAVIKHLDRKNRTLEIKAPDGLIELYC